MQLHVLLFWRVMPTLKPVLFTTHQMQPFRPSAPIQEGPTFIQTCHSSLESQVLDFTHANKDQVYQISSCQQFRNTLHQFYHHFLEKKHPWHLNHFQWGRSRNNRRTYICQPFLSALHTVSTQVSCIFFFFLSVSNGSWLPCDPTSPVKWPHTISKICVKMPSKSRQNQEDNSFSSSGPPLTGLGFFSRENKNGHFMWIVCLSSLRKIFIIIIFFFFFFFLEYRLLQFGFML